MKKVLLNYYSTKNENILRRNFKVKKRLLISVLIIGLLAVGAVLGSLAYYQASFTSANNQIKAAVFNVGTDGTLTETQNFNFDKLAPGEYGFYDFRINKDGTEVPVKYTINVTPTGDLFGEGTPIKFGLQRSTNEGNHNNSRDYDEVIALQSGTLSYILDPAQFDVERFRLVWNWQSGASDNNFNGLTGNVAINVVADQIQENAINAQVYHRDKGVSPTVSGSGTNKVIFGYEGGQKVLIVKDNAYFGNVKFTATGSGDSLDAVLVSSTSMPSFDGTSFKINKLTDGFVQIIKFGPEVTLEITIPAGVVDSWFAS